MKLFFAGIFTALITPEDEFELFRRRLMTYAYESTLDTYDMYDKENILIDSGAFSAKYAKSSKLLHVNPDDYEAFLRERKPKYYIQLDSIGDHDATFANYVRMRENGFDPLPVIHCGAPRKHIERVLSLGEYICLGGIAKGRGDQFDAFMSFVFGHKLARGKRFHLLGITTESILKRYPAYSCDSSSVLAALRYPVTNPKSVDKSIMRSHQLDSWRNKNKGKYKEVLRISTKKFNNLEEDITEYWTARGVVWD